jgi:hypothetical protein
MSSLPNASDPGACAALAASLWAELGAPLARLHSHVAVDPEPLIVFTPTLARNEGRLLGLAASWCLRYEARISASRLAHVAKRAPRGVAEAWEAFRGDLAAHGGSWGKPAPSPRPVDVRVVGLDITRPALIRLRMRGLAGVAARADVLVELLARANEWHSAQVGDPIATRRSTDVVLTDLVATGLVDERTTGGRREVRLAEPNALARLVGGAADLAYPSWAQIFEWMLLAEQELGAGPPATAEAQVSEAARRRALRTTGRDLGLPDPGPDLGAWASLHASQLANGSSPLFALRSGRAARVRSW